MTHRDEQLTGDSHTGSVRSRLAQTLSRGWTGRLSSVLRDTSNTFRTWAKYSAVYRGSQTLREWCTNSWTVRLARSSRGWLRTSITYQLILSDVERDVPTVDLSGTLTVGPLVSVTSSVTDAFRSAWPRSTLRRQVNERFDLAKRVFEAVVRPPE
jgi:hypothetical protein